jgi:protein-S-isoprenylcysteine O-methyltransferase Ste14
MSEEQDHAGVVTHPPVFYIIATIIGLGVDYIYPLSFEFQGNEKTAGIVFVILGTLITALEFKMFASKKQSPSVHASVSEVYQSGIFAYSRNPIYLGVMLWMISGALFYDKLWILIMVGPLVIFMNKVVIEKEEAYLSHKFGDDYLNYMKKVRRWI